MGWYCFEWVGTPWRCISDYGLLMYELRASMNTDQPRANALEQFSIQEIKKTRICRLVIQVVKQHLAGCPRVTFATERFPSWMEHAFCLVWKSERIQSSCVSNAYYSKQNPMECSWVSVQISSWQRHLHERNCLRDLISDVCASWELPMGTVLGC